MSFDTDGRAPALDLTRDAATIEGEISESFKKATKDVDGAAIMLKDGREVSRLGRVGAILVNGRPTAELEVAAVEALATELRQLAELAAKDEGTPDPAENDFIKVP